ncbi:ATPase [Spirochaetia bacterium]|nr:ATPase [Spirochaetia bacterium]GHU94249.1 ATPase [Spirochaetia bacterium]
MEFYGREKEIAQIQAWNKQAHTSAQMTVVTGRRRIGKTTLIRRALETKADTPSVYFFAVKKSEALLCDEFIGIIKETLQVDIPGEFRFFRDVFKFLMILSQSRSFSLVIDEFQEFFTINSAVYSEMQNLWDTYKNKAKIHLILCGSVYSLMKRIFENAHEPLFGRTDHRLLIMPFSVDTQKQILTDYSPQAANRDLLALYAAAGGVPRYIELLINEKAFTHKKILDALLEENSFFLDEGRSLLIEEFGKDYTTYFSILSLIASSKTSRPGIESIIGQSVGPHIERLENDFVLIKRVIPLFAKPGTRQIRYAIDDNFLNFWFRFIYKYRSAIEIGNRAYVRKILDRDYTSYTGRILEKYFREKLILTGKYSAIGPWWEKGNLNEIDIVAVNEMKKQMLIGEVKLQAKEIRMRELEAKAAALVKDYRNYAVTFAGFSVDDM